MIRSSVTAVSLALVVVAIAACGSAPPLNADGRGAAAPRDESSTIEVRALAFSDADLPPLFEATPPRLVAWAAWQVPVGANGNGYALTGDSVALEPGVDPDGTLKLSGRLTFHAPPAAAVVVSGQQRLALPEVVILDAGRDPTALDALDPAALPATAWLGFTSTEMIYVAPESMNATLAADGLVAGVNDNTSDAAGHRGTFTSVMTGLAPEWTHVGQQSIPLLATP